MRDITDQIEVAPGEAIDIGMLFSATGALATTEQSVQQGAVLAVEQVNARGGVSGRPLRLLASDYGSDPATAGRCARELVQRDGVSVLLGGYTSASRVTISPAVDPVEGLYLFPTYYEGLESDPATAYLGAVPNQYLEDYVAWILGELGSRIYVVGSDYVYPRTIGAILRGLVRNDSAEIVAERYLPIGASDMSRIAREIVDLAPDVILCNLVGVDSVGAFYRAYAEAGLSPDALPIAATVTSELEISEVGAEYVAGHYMVSTYFSSLDEPANREYVAALEAHFGGEAVPHVTQVGAYNAVWVLADALERSGGIPGADLREAIVGARFDGNPEGMPVVIERNRHSVHPAYIGRATEAGYYEVIASFEPVEPDPYPPSLVRSAKRPRDD